MNRRVVPIVIAVVLAIVAGALVFFFARSAENRALADEQPVNVLVTTQPIPQGHHPPGGMPTPGHSSRPRCPFGCCPRVRSRR